MGEDVNRHAELIVPEKCSLKYLKKIVCRSAAEKETFVNMLDWKIRKKYIDIIVVDTRNSFFEKKWTYVEDVTLSKEKIILNFNNCRQSVQFKAYLEILEEETQTKYTWENEVFEPKQNKVFSLVNLKHSECYDVEFYLDGNLAYKGTYIDDDYLPF